MRTESSEDLKARHRKLKSSEPSIRERDAAKRLGVSEGELLSANVGESVTRLQDDPEQILKSLKPLGQLMALTRNEFCVHERKGVYDKCQFFKHGPAPMGMFVNPDIDLRLFMSRWRHCFAAEQESKIGIRRSLQFFDRFGDAVHKVYLTDKSERKAFKELVAARRHADQSPLIEVEPAEPPVPELPDSKIDWSGLKKEWRGLKDTHDFFLMLKKFKAGRLQALKNVGEEFARKMANNAARKALELARDGECEIMVFVGNPGCIQIHTGKVKKLVEYAGWFNVLDPMFNLHLRESKIAESWVTEKPTADGHVTALELFDRRGELIATFFGRRKPGNPELEQWRRLIAELPADEQNDDA